MDYESFKTMMWKARLLNGGKIRKMDHGVVIISNRYYEKLLIEILFRLVGVILFYWDLPELFKVVMDEL